MKKFKKIMVLILIFGVILEGGLLVRETYTYINYKYCHFSINGRIVAKVDNLINFSGMASK